MKSLRKRALFFCWVPFFLLVNDRKIVSLHFKKSLNEPPTHIMSINYKL